MIKAKLNKKKGTGSVYRTGPASEITAEALTILKIVYLNIRMKDKDAADAFKRTIIGAVLDPKSPVWEAGNGKEK